MLSFKNLQDNVLTFLDQAGDTDTGLDLVKYAINQAQEKRVSQERWSFMLSSTPVPITFVADQRNYVLKPNVMFLSEFWNRTGNQLMKETPTRARYKVQVLEDRYHFEFISPAPVKQQPTLGTITVTGEVEMSYVAENYDTITETLNNTTTSQSVREVLKVSKVNEGTSVTLVDAGANTILTLTPTQVGFQYPQIRLYDNGRAETGDYRYYRKPTLLELDGAVPDIPYPHSRILVYDALLELATYNDMRPPDFWLMQQSQLETLMRQAYQEGETEGSESRTVLDVDSYTG
jgi:hypothetical protein